MAVPPGGSVDPSSFQRSAGLTGGGTVSWQLAPARFDGVPEGPDGDAALAAAAVALAGAVRGPHTPQRPGIAGALLLADGTLTTDTSLREPLGRHPVATAVLSEVIGELTEAGRSAGLGRCVEVTLVSTRLYELDQRWTAAGRPGDLRSFALDALRGATIAIRQIGAVNGHRHGDARSPCRSCTLFLARFGIEASCAPADATAEPVSPVMVPTPGDMESRSTARREWLLGTRFAFAGTGPAGLVAVEARLRAAGPGSTALVLATWTTANPGPYAWTAAYRNGSIEWLDNPSRESSAADPLYASTVDSVWSIVLDVDGRPCPPVGHPLPASTGAPLDPDRPTMHDHVRLAEIRLLATAYADADPPERVAVRAEISALVDAVGVRPGTVETNVRWAALPPDVAAHLLTLATAVPAPRTVATVLAADPARLNPPQRAWQADYRAHLADALAGRPRPDRTGSDPVAAELADRAHRLAVAGEHAPASVPRLPAYAGQVIGLPPDRIAVLRISDPALADRAAAAGIYVDLTGRPDLSPYAATGFAPVPLPDEPGPHTDAGRARQRDVDRAYARAALRSAHAGEPAVLAVLTTHDFHYVGPVSAGGPRTMALVPDLIADAVRAITPIGPAPRTKPAPVTAPTRAVAARAAVPAATAATPAAPGPAAQTPDGVDIAYYALADGADVPAGLLVVAMLPTGPQSVRWETPGARTAGSPNPVSRERAEEITRQTLGFELPPESRLPELLNG